LIVFAFVVGFNSLGLMMDAALYSVGFITVTEFCRKNPWLTGIIISINAIGLIGLGLHFSNLNGEE
jgi:arginine exporter protein ArgO